MVSGYRGNVQDYSQVVDIISGTTCSYPPSGVSYPIRMNTGVGTTLDDIPLICGGLGYKGGYTRLTECYKFDKTSNSWSLLANMVHGREAPAGSVLNGKLWVTGKIQKYTLPKIPYMFCYKYFFSESELL